MKRFTQNTCVIVVALLLGACVTVKQGGDGPSPKSIEFFKDYVAHDGPKPDTLPVFLSACRGDVAAMTDIFSNYERYGSGDNETWVDVPDVILREVGDQAFAKFAINAKPAVRMSALQHLGLPGSSLIGDPELREKYPWTTYLQARFVYPPPRYELLPPKPEGLEWPPR